MLRLIEGGFYSSAYRDIKAEILALTKVGKRVFLIVPEQQSVVAEKEMIGYLPESAPLSFELTNFTRLSNSVSRQLGGVAGEFADSAKQSLIMWKTLTELSPFLTITEGSEVNFGTTQKMLSAVSEMKSISVSAEELAALASHESLKSNNRLISKLDDLSKVLALYNKLLHDRYSDAKDECERLAEKLDLYPEAFSDCEFFISGFSSFTEPQYKVISSLMRHSSLTVHLTISKLHRDFFEFSEIKKTEERILRLADRASVNKKLINRGLDLQCCDTQLSEVCDLLWRNFGKIDNDSLQNIDDKIRVFEASDPYEEVNFAASDIKRRVMLGESYKNFAIVVRDSEKYAGILDAVFEAADIPCFISKRKDTSSYEAIKLIYTAFATVEGGFRREDVISFSKCKLSDISAEACDEFELYTEVWQIDKGRFTDGIFWNMSPEGYTVRRSKDTDEALCRINETRFKLVDPLIKFGENLKEAKTVREYAAALVGFLTDLSVEAKIKKQINILSSLGELDAARENGMLWDIICSSLDAMVEVLGDTEITPRAFVNQLKVTISSTDIGKIPVYSDVITVGSADMIRLSDKKHIYLLGVNNGEFPRSKISESYFSERDKTTLSALGLATEADSEIAEARELFFFSRAFSAASESVTIIYSLRNEALAASAPSSVIERLSYISNGLIKPKKISNLSLDEKLYFPSPAIEFSARNDVKDALVDSGYEKEVRLSSKSVTNENLKLLADTTHAMYPASLALTQTRIETYVNCPFSYFLKYNIKLSENEKAKFDARSIGTFIHAMLENFFGELSENGQSAGDLTKVQKDELIKRAAKRYISGVVESEGQTSKRTDILLDRLCRAAEPVIDGLCDELRDCSFVPRFFELKIGKGDDELPSPATFKDSSGNEVSVYGSIDRVDIYESGDDIFVRVIDYKTGAKEFSPDDIDDGKNLQMFLYLKSIVDTDNEVFKKKLGVKGDGKIIPAGVIYVKTDMSDVTIPHANEESEKDAIRKKQKRRGMLLNDSESISAMNKDYIPVKFTKSGAPDSRSEKFLYTREGWEELGEKISNKVCEISDKIKSGEISLTDKTKDSPCDFCSFKAVCRKK